MAQSSSTFQAERDSLRPVPGVFWEGLEIQEVLAGVLDQPFLPADDSNSLEQNTARRETRSAFPYLPETPFQLFDSEGVVERISTAAKTSDEQFADAVWQTTGIDIEEALDRGKPTGTLAEQAVRLQAMTANFGTDAFGSYLPWHAFGESATTPWGIYIFPEKIIEWANLLHASGTYLPSPKPQLLSVMRLLWWVTYRHELFHFHVEMFATRLESALRKPVYRPYVDLVRSKVSGTKAWWEEALAQAVVLRSSMVKNALGVDAAYMKQYVVPYFKTFPDGYRHFECKEVGGPAEAHRILSAQIARAEERPAAPTTDIAVAKNEYAVSSSKVPGYLLVMPSFSWRFQLATPKWEDVIRYSKRNGYSVDDHAPGDHKRVIINGVKVQLNKSRRGNHIDLASAKALARQLARFSHQPFLTSSKSEKAKVWRNCREFEKRKK